MPRKRLSTAPKVECPAGFKQCTQCGGVMPTTSFSKASARSDGLRQQCRACCSKYNNQAATSEWKKKNKDRVRHHEATYAKRNPLKVRARQVIRNRVHRGTLIRPNLCESCGLSGPTEAHHHDHRKPLDVAWLCKACHSQLSRRIFRNATL